MWALAALAMVGIGIAISGPLKRQFVLLKTGRWRPGASVFGIAAIVAGLFLVLRGALSMGGSLIAAGVVGLLSLRNRPRAAPKGSAFPAMDKATAAAILGISEHASVAEVQSAYLRLMRRAHPDTGGSTGLAVQLNRARDVMTGRTPSQ